MAKGDRYKFTCCGCDKTVVRILGGGGVRPKWCSENCRKRTWNRRWLASEKSRAVCPDCGEKLAPGSARPHLVRRREKARGTQNQSCPGCARKKRKQIMSWWAEGLTMPEICELLGISKTQLAVDMVRMRELGYDLPYRYTTGKRAGTKHPDQVAA
jgi:hypothetical protein